MVEEGKPLCLPSSDHRAGKIALHSQAKKNPPEFPQTGFEVNLLLTGGLLKPVEPFSKCRYELTGYYFQN